MKTFILIAGLAFVASVAHASIPVIKVVQRDHIVTIKADGVSPLYSVETKSGELLVRDVRPEDLKRLQPEVYELVREAIAGPPGGIIDASLTPN